MTEVRDVDRSLRRFTGSFVKALQGDLLRGLVRETRKDTGFTASGWSPSVRVPDPVKTPRPSSREAARAEASLRMAKNASRSAAIKAVYKIESGMVFVVNATPPITILMPDSKVDFVIQASIDSAARSIASQVNR